MEIKEICTRWMKTSLVNKVGIGAFGVGTLCLFLFTCFIFMLSLEFGGGFIGLNVVSLLLSLGVMFGLLTLSKIARFIGMIWGFYSGLYLLTLIVLVKMIPFLEDLIAMSMDVLTSENVFVLICYIGIYVAYLISYICFIVGKKSYRTAL